jgi:hypothetical protein
MTMVKGRPTFEFFVYCMTDSRRQAKGKDRLIPLYLIGRYPTGFA